MAITPDQIRVDGRLKPEIEALFGLNLVPLKLKPE
jgi:hypothetical protein